jgi:uncharacterized delta-60 repeat protein
VDGFDPGADGNVYALAIQPDGKILVGGAFFNLAGQPRRHLGRLNTDGTLDATFDPGADSAVYCLGIQEDGDILVGGAFTTVGGTSRNHIARLNADGSLDVNFNPGADSNVDCIALEPGGRILIGGSFTNVTEQPRSCMARLYSNGSLDMTFNPEVGGETIDGAPSPFVVTLAVQSDGKILVGGDFYTLNGQSRYAIGRLHSDGTLDTNFNATANWIVASFAVQPDGQIVAAGGFDRLVGQQRAQIGRLNTDGSLDTSFNPGPVPMPFQAFYASLALQANGKVLAGDLVDGFVLSNGPPLICKYDTQGTIETNSSVIANSDVTCLALQADGKVLTGGLFTMLAGQARNRIGRLTNLDGVTQSLSWDSSSITWLRGGASPEAWRTSFAWSTNGTGWVSLGSGTHISGGWQISQLSIPTNAIIRARGFVTGGCCNGSTWFVETLLGPQTQPTIVNDGTVGFHSNKFGFNILGSVGRTVVVEGSTNLVHWTPLTTNIIGSGLLSFSDPDTTNYRARFYRVRSQ